MKRLTLPLLVLLLVALCAAALTACGDDAEEQDGETGGQMQEQSEQEYDLEDTAGAASDDLGGDMKQPMRS